MKTLILALDEACLESELIGNLGPNGARHIADEALRPGFYDTFDWRLFEKGLTLVQLGQTVRLCRIADGDAICAARVRGKLEGRFGCDFPKGALRDALMEGLSVRALLRKGEVFQYLTHWGVLNKDGKTVVRATISRVARERDTLSSLSYALALKGVRGYDAEFDATVARLAARGIHAPGESAFAVAMAAHGQTPGAYASKPEIRLDPGATGQVATRVILRHLLDVMVTNEDGIRADWDTEFLHDFRVAIRCSRSALAQIKGVLPDDAVAHFRAGFRDLGHATNRLRDLDVYLLNEMAYRALLPEPLQPGLDGLFARLRTQRRRALRDLKGVLEGSFYRALVEEWAAFLDGSRVWLGAAPHADMPIVDLARGFIWKRYRRVLKKGKRITDETPAADLHALRIDGKKLRYMLELFASLFPAEEMATLVGLLKKLQDNLGDFNDLAVQQADLQRDLESALGRRRKRDEALIQAAAMGGLIARLNDRQQVVRAEFADAFDAFAHRDNRRLYSRLFGKKGEA